MRYRSLIVSERRLQLSSALLNVGLRINPPDPFGPAGKPWHTKTGYRLYIPSSMASHGIYRERNGWGTQHRVRVKYDEHQELDLAEDRYRARGASTSRCH